MGKKNKHSKDKLHKTVTELSSHHIGQNRDLELSILHRRLKFDSCCLSLNAIAGRPVGLCDDDNFCYVFDCDLIVEFLKKYQVHPITGSKVTASNLIDLKYHRNNENRYHCPVTLKLFNQHSKIVANKKSGNVYSYEAYHQLNLKPKNFNDLLTDEPFDRNDIVYIQDPERADEKWSVKDFYYVKNKLKVEDDSGESKIRNIEPSSILKSSLEEYKRQADAIAATHNKIVGQDDELFVGPKVKLDKINSASYSDGSLARSVTSTEMPITSVQNPAILSNDSILYPKIKKKGYLQLVTNLGPINLELFCDRTPKTCHNFLLLASRGYYNGTCFHRLIKNFILQGGDPTGTGSGGQSAWGEPFKDECHGDLKHVGRGVVAMANSGPSTNKSQFYITLRGNWDHLDGKHTVFGRVVGGEETLDRIESIEVDKKDRPKKEIKILSITKYCDPFEEVEAALEEERRRESESNIDQRQQDGNKRAGAQSSTQPLKRFRSGIGAYINLDTLHQKSTAPSTSSTISKGADAMVEVQSNGSCNKATLASKLAGLACKGKAGKGRALGDFSDW